MNKIAVIGTGYVGLVTGTCLADFGMQVTCVDSNEEKIQSLKNGKVAIYEPELNDILARNIYYKRIKFTTDIKKAVEENEILFIAVGTPPSEDGSADLHYVNQVANNIGKYLNGFKVVVNKSTVPLGTGQNVKQIIKKEIEKRNLNYDFDVVSNPEFLREGSAIHDFTHPDRVVIGAESENAINIMKDVYRVLYINETPFVITNIETAELIKYASNAFLATKISFVNELSELCEKTGADIQYVTKAMGMDGRIGAKFLHVGPGYGGSCFPKDTKALLNIAKNYDCNLGIVKATIDANVNQKLRLAKKISDTYKECNNETLAILGLAFKNNTDDMRESSALIILNELAKKGFKFRVYDPKAMSEARWRFSNIIDKITFCKDEYDAASGADGIVIITEWNQFRSLNLDKIREVMNDNYFFDLRNIYSKDLVKNKGFKYFSVGR